MKRFLSNIWNLGYKELYSLVRDPVLLIMVIYIFTLGVYSAATAMPESLHRAPIAIVDEDGSQLSARLADAFYPPYFSRPYMISRAQMDEGLDSGSYTFALYIPSGFQRDLLASRSPSLQLNVDATMISQAYTGSGYIQNIASGEISAFMKGHREQEQSPVALDLRVRFNPQLDRAWFGSIMEIINNITLLAVVLTGAALIREREHGTIEHLLVMPVTPLEIMVSKVWTMGLVVLLASGLSLKVVVQGLLHVPIYGSLGLFVAGAALYLFASTAMGIFLGTVSRSMPQFGLLLILILLPLEMLSGGMTPQESMPDMVRHIMQAAPTTHFVTLAQAVLYRGAGLQVVWPQFVALAAIGSALFGMSLGYFRKALSTMA
ncbi:MAG: ABC transporter permease [Desulfovibrionaceae bacterium]|nr:ABC transporter permease [Desulfovibrionaceae bacterium]